MRPSQPLDLPALAAAPLLVTIDPPRRDFVYVVSTHDANEDAHLAATLLRKLDTAAHHLCVADVHPEPVASEPEPSPLEETLRRILDWGKDVS